MQTGNPHIIETHYFVSMYLTGKCCLLRNRDIRGTSRCHHDPAQSVGSWYLTHNTDSGTGLVTHGKLFLHLPGLLLLQAGNQNRLLSMPPHTLCDSDDLLPGLAGSVDNFCRPLSDLSVQIDLGISQFFEGLLLDRKHRLIH